MEVDGAGADADGAKMKSKSKGSGSASKEKDNAAALPQKRSKIVALIPCSDDMTKGDYDVVVVSDAGRVVRIKWDQKLDRQLGSGAQIIKLNKAKGEKAVAGCVASVKDTLVLQRSDGYVMHTSFRALKQETLTATGRVGVNVKFCTKPVKSKVYGGGKGEVKETIGDIVDIQAARGAADLFDGTKVTMSMEEFGVKPVAPAQSAADHFAADKVAEVMAN